MNHTGPAEPPPDELVAPTRADPFARRMSEVVGGPVGRHARPHSWWVPVRVLLALFAVVFSLGLVQHEPCLKTDWTGDQARYGKMCYSDLPYQYTGRGYAEGLWPYSDSGDRYQVTEYPVGISYLAWTAAKLTQLDPEGPPMAQRRTVDPGQVWSLPGMAAEVNSYFLVNALLLCLFGLLATWFLAGTHRGRPWDALFFVLSPALLATELVNWDLMAVALVAGALWAWSRGKPLIAGVMIGLGAATKLYPLFLLGPVLLVAWRRRQLSLFGLAVAGAVGAWVLANAPAWLTGYEQWKVFWTFNADRGADLGSIWLVLAHQGVSVSPGAINSLSWWLFGAICLAVGLLGLRARETPRMAQLAFLVVAGFLLVNKVYSPQYVLWLLPLAVLARPRWRDLLIWQAGELLYFAAVWMYLGGWLAASAGDGVPAYDLAIVLRMAAQLYLVVVVVRDIMYPEHDPVRTDGMVQGAPAAPGRPAPTARWGRPVS
ncbi:MAG: integral rane protein [Marmoricola sp.]|nr:integral rane protein [Marmoricola sp.]